jgi:hypothetical protein
MMKWQKAEIILKKADIKILSEKVYCLSAFAGRLLQLFLHRNDDKVQRVIGGKLF